MPEKYIHLSKFPDCYMVDVCFDNSEREMTEFYVAPEHFDGEVICSCIITRRNCTKKSDGQEIIVAKGVSPESSLKASYEEALKFAKIRAKDLERKILDFTSKTTAIIELNA
jgi:hypothetical protein